MVFTKSSFWRFLNFEVANFYVFFVRKYRLPLYQIGNFNHVENEQAKSETDRILRLNCTTAKRYSGTWELGTPKGLSETVLNSEVILFLRSISM